MTRIPVLIATALIISSSVPANAQVPGVDPQFISSLAQGLGGATNQQAEGAAGAIFGLAKSRLSAEDFAKVAGAVPGMDGLLKAAPAPAAASAIGTSGVANLAGLSSVAGAFSKLGLKPDMVSKAIPIITGYVTKSGGSAVGNILAGVLK
jgi:hypothetical protein